MNRKTIEQERAKFCLDKVKNIQKNRKEFKSAAKKLPAFIVNNGLLSTLAFYKSKKLEKSDVHNHIYNIISEWLAKRKFINKNDAIESLLDSDFEILRLATIEALAIANWLKRIAEAEIDE